MNKLYSILNASSIMSNLMLKDNYTHIQLSKGKWHTMITVFYHYADMGAYQLRNELREVVPDNCTFEIKNFEENDTSEGFTTLEITWEYNEE